MITVKGATNVKTDVIVIEGTREFETIEYNGDAEKIMAIFRETLPETTYRILIEKLVEDYREMVGFSP